MPKPLGLLYTGHSLDILKSMESESVQTCITSPPYWGLRDYAICSCRVDADPDCVKCNGTGRNASTDHVWGGDPACNHVWVSETVKGQSGGPSDKQKSNAGSWFAPSTCSTCSAWYGSLGNEPEPDLFIKHLVMIFREVKRLLRDNGTLWVNIGDSYAGSGGPHKPEHASPGISVSAYRSPAYQSTLKPKDLVGIPWLLAFALRADGWYLRQDIIWSKKNCMPESVTDRCVKSHEYVFLLSKSKQYYFDHIAIREPAVEYAKGKRKVSLGAKSLSRGQAAGANVVPSGNALVSEVELSPVRNKRSVWHMSSKPFKGAHFATFPEELVTTPIIAGTSEYGCCSACGVPYTRIVEKLTVNPGAVESTKRLGRKSDSILVNGRNIQDVNSEADRRDQITSFNNNPLKRPVIENRTVGWQQSCECRDAHNVPCVILDPFSGAATTGKVALELGRNYIGIEQSSDYNTIAEKRLLDAGLDCVVL